MVQPFVVVALLAWAEAGPPDQDLTAAVRKLLRQADSPVAEERARAEAALVELGPDVLDLLPHEGPQQSAQVTLIVGRVRGQLERRLAERTAKPSLVTLQSDAMPLPEVLAAIGKQTGNALRLDENLPEDVKTRKLKVAFDKTPFWQALDQVLDQAGLTVYPYGEGPGLSVVLRPEAQVARGQGATYSGPFRFAPLRISAHRELRATMGDHLELAVEAAWEPRVAPIVLKQPMQSVEAVDDKGNRLAPASPEAESGVPVAAGQSAAEIELQFGLPPREASRITSLKGSLTAVLPGKMQKFRFDKLADARNVEERRAGVTVALRQVRKNNEIWQVLVLVRYDQAGEAFQSHYDWFYRNKAWLEDADGKTVESGGMETFRRTETEVGLTYNFDIDKPIDRYKFCYETPGLLITKEFPYEIKDVKLP